MALKNEEKADALKNVPYREALRGLMYAYQTVRPNLGCAITTLESFAENPGRTHWNALKRLLHYLKGTKNYLLKFGDSKETKLVEYSDAD